MPGYNAATNHYTLGGTTYDANGNLPNDTFNTYTWDAEGKVAAISQSSNMYQYVRDALGQVVEYQTNGVATSEVTLLGGFKINMNGQVLGASSEIPL